jgi:peptidoglycan/LPS O-acetylase OafA/YrhL
MGASMVQASYSEGQAGSARLARLDGLRGMAACVVAFAYHGRNLFAPGQFADDGGIVYWFQFWGWTFVDLFFVLSGYIFAHVYLREGGLPESKAVGDFAAARFARLYPLHLLMLLVVACFAWNNPDNSPQAFVAHLFMLQAFVPPVAHTFVGPSWSLSVEMICYVIFALAAASSRKALGWVTTLAIGGALLHLVFFGKLGGPWVGDNLPRALLGFFLGQTLWRFRGSLARVPAIVFVGVLAAGMMIDSGRLSPLLPLCLLAWPAALLLGLRLPVLESAPLKWLGDHSYAIYLIHFPLIQLSLYLFGPLSGGWGLVIAAHAGLVALTLVLSDAALRWVELPSRNAIRARWERWARASDVTGERIGQPV